MKEFIKENIISVIILGIIALLVIGLGIWGITKLVSSDDKKMDNNPETSNVNKPEKGKYDSINDAKDLVDSNTIEKLYNNILGIGYNKEVDGKIEYISEIYQDELVTFEDLKEESILRAGISQVAICGSEYENQKISYSVISKKINEIFGKSLNEVSASVPMTTGTYSCDNEQCSIEGNYCTKLPLKGKYELISVAADFNNSNILYLYEQAENGLMYRHTFKNNDNNYYWYSTEPLTK